MSSEYGPHIRITPPHDTHTHARTRAHTHAQSHPVSLILCLDCDSTDVEPPRRRPVLGHAAGRAQVLRPACPRYHAHSTRFLSPLECTLTSEAPHVLPPGEFRVFVHSGQVRGISQYDTLCYFPHLVQQKTTIAALILEFQETLHQRVGHLFDDYVLDLALLDDPAQAAPTPHRGTFVPGMCPPRSPVARSSSQSCWWRSIHGIRTPVRRSSTGSRTSRSWRVPVHLSRHRTRSHARTHHPHAHAHARHATQHARNRTRTC